jgi:glycosyltransferase involved in cell wall biosynthesis
VLLPLFPWAIERFRPEGYDLVLSTSHAVAKGIRCEPGCAHLCYCFTPMRYVWDQSERYLGTGVRRALATPLVARLRAFDVRTSGPERVSRFVAISTTVKERIAQHYGRESEIVFPPVDVDRIVPDGSAPDDFYLLVGGFVPYKCEGIAIEAFRALHKRLVIVGDGPNRARLQKNSPANVEFTGRIPDRELARLYARCRALLYPQEEDFGIAAVEAQAAGRPVIAFGRGGATDTVTPLGRAGDAAPTGLWFDEQSPDALAEAIQLFERHESEFDAQKIRGAAQRFSPQCFLGDLEHQIALSRQA